MKSIQGKCGDILYRNLIAADDDEQTFNYRWPYKPLVVILKIFKKTDIFTLLKTFSLVPESSHKLLLNFYNFSKVPKLLVLKIPSKKHYKK